jgi:xanthine/uracil permease
MVSFPMGPDAQPSTRTSNSASSNPQPATCNPQPATCNPQQFLYDLDDKPPVHRAILYGLQWAVIMFPTLIIAAALPGKVLHLNVAGEVRFLQLVLLTSGLFSAVQCLWGHRYPLLDGPSTAVLLTYILLAPHGLQAVQGGTIAGGLLLVAVVMFGKLRRILSYMTPNVVGVILMLIAVSLLPYLTQLMTGATGPGGGASAAKFVTAVGLVILMATLAHRLKGFWSSVALLLGMLVGTAVFTLLEEPRWAELFSALWLSLPHDVVPSGPRLTWVAAVAFGSSYVAVVVNSVGSIQGIANVTSKDRLERAVSRGLFLNGVEGVVCGLMGIVGMVSYSISPGVVLANRVASRFAVVYCGAILALAAFLPKLAALLSLIPPPVVGAALCVAMGVQVGAALGIVSSGGMSRRDYYVVGLPVVIGAMLGFLPESLVNSAPEVLRVFLGNGLTFGIVFVLLLEHVFLREKTKGNGESVSR